jgi:hypothetical protein
MGNETHEMEWEILTVAVDYPAANIASRSQGKDTCGSAPLCEPLNDGLNGHW